MKELIYFDRVIFFFLCFPSPCDILKKYFSTSQALQPLMKCRKVFQALIKLAVEELCETADSLIAPVRLGVARPTAPFTLTNSAMEVINGSEELFSIEPLIPHSGVSSQTLDATLQTQQGNNNITIARDVSAMDETEAGEGMFYRLINENNAEIM